GIGDPAGESLLCGTRENGSGDRRGASQDRRTKINLLSHRNASYKLPTHEHRQPVARIIHEADCRRGTFTPKSHSARRKSAAPAQRRRNARGATAPRAVAGLRSTFHGLERRAPRLFCANAPPRLVDTVK